MNIWLVTDTHFNHDKLETWGGRSGDWQNELWRGISHIPKSDLLIHLGDICIGDDIAINALIGTWAKANGFRTMLVRGNHDKKSLAWYMENGWDMAVDGIQMLFEGHYLHLTHRPSQPEGITTFNIHGHTHGNLHRSEESREFYSYEYHIDISPELVGYKPVRLDTLLKLRKKRKFPTAHDD